jgi:hypothetical protein
LSQETWFYVSLIGRILQNCKAERKLSRSAHVAAASPQNARFDNVAGHRARYEYSKAHLPREEIGVQFVWGRDPVGIGFIGLGIIRHFRALKGAFGLDIGCGIGRLTRHLRHEDIAGYLGVDIIPEIIQEAIDSVEGDARFSFALGEMPHPETRRSETRPHLKPGGIAVFSFLDFVAHADSFSPMGGDASVEVRAPPPRPRPPCRKTCGRSRRALRGRSPAGSVRCRSRCRATARSPVRSLLDMISLPTAFSARYISPLPGRMSRSLLK